VQDILERAMKLRTQFAEIWHKKGSDFLRAKKYEEAKVALNQAIRIKPRFGRAWYDLAGIFAIEGSRDRALSHLEKAIELDKKYKGEATTDEKFQGLWADSDFRRLTT